MIAHVLTFAAHRRVLVCGALSDAGITDLGRRRPYDLGRPARLTACRSRPVARVS